jgi:hypothetical protein
MLDRSHFYQPNFKLSHYRLGSLNGRPSLFILGGSLTWEYLVKTYRLRVKG